MNIEFDIDSPEHIHVRLERDWVTGKFTCTVNNKVILLRNPRKLSTHFNFNLKYVYKIEVGEQTKHRLDIEHQRPLIFGAIRPNTYRVFVDGKLVKEHRG